MNTQLKKGDKCQSPWGVVTVNNVLLNGIVGVIDKDGAFYAANIQQLTRIPSHAERMQAVLDIAWDVENRLEPHETVQFTVEAFVEFARHYVDMQDQLEHWRQLFNRHESGFALASKQIEKLLKGETL